MNELLRTITPLTNEMYHFSGTSLQQYYDKFLQDDEYVLGLEPHEIAEKLLNGTLTQEQLKEIEENLVADAECGALWNYVHIAKMMKKKQPDKCY